MYVSKRQICSWAEQTKCNNLLLRKKNNQANKFQQRDFCSLRMFCPWSIKVRKSMLHAKVMWNVYLACLRVGCNYYHQCHICFFALLAYESDLPLREARNCLFNTNSIIMLSKPWAVITWIRKCCLPTSVTFQSLRIQLCLLTPQTGMTWMRWILPNLDE